MSLETAIENLTAAINSAVEHTQVATPATQKKAATPAKEKAPAKKKAAAKKKAEAPEYNDLVQVVLKLGQKHTRSAIEDLLTEFEVGNMKELDASKYAEVIERAVALTEAEGE